VFTHGFNSLTIFFEDECRLTLKIEGRVMPKMMYELYIAESYTGAIDKDPLGE